MKRRDFITLLGGAAAWPLVARAQQKLPTIGFLGSTARWTESPRDAALLERLRELGWIEGRTVAIEHRWAENRMERYAEIATEGRRHSYIWHCSSSVQAGHIGYSDRLYHRRGPGRAWSRREPRPTRQQRHRPLSSIDRSCRQAARNPARASSEAPSAGGHGQC